METSDLDQKKVKFEAEQARITERVEQLMARVSREVVNNFTEQYAAFESQMNRVSERLDTVDREKADRAYRERQCRLFLKALPTAHNNDGESAQSRNDLFLALVDKVIVWDKMTFILRDGTEWTV